MSFDQPNNDDNPQNVNPGQQPTPPSSAPDYPGSAASASGPGGQAPGPYSQQSPYGAYNPYSQGGQPQQQPTAGGQGQGGGWDQGQAGWGQGPEGYPTADFSAPPPGQGPVMIRDASPLKAMFDFSFNSFATPGLVKLVYGLSMVIAVLYWLGLIIFGFLSGSFSGAVSPYTGTSSSGFNPVPGILAILLGWIPAFLWILLIRIGLEFAIATVRTSEDIRHIRANA